MSIEQLLPLINSGGIVAVLLFQAVLFLRGDIIPAALLEKIVHVTVESLLEELSDGARYTLQDAKRTGVSLTEND